MIANCRYCETDSLIQIIDFVPTPYGDLYQEDKKTATELLTVPLTLARCTNCKLLQLLHQTDISLQYDNYLYFSSVTNTLTELYSRIAKRYIHEFRLSNDSLIVDIGSNDGTYLNQFRPLISNLLGIEPSKPACKKSLDEDIEVINDYFDEKVAQAILSTRGHASLISCNFTFANLPHIRSFFTNVKTLMNKNTVLSIITGYHLDQFQVSMFDYIGHDHLTYFTLNDIHKFAAENGLRVVFAFRHEIKGGSIEIGIVRNDSDISEQENVRQIMQRELWVGPYNNSFIYQLKSRIEVNRNTVKEMLAAMSHLPGFTIGYGASISSTCLIAEFHLGQEFDFLIDDDVKKQGLFSPGNGIHVKSPEDILKEKIKCIVILGWQHTNKILTRISDLGFHGFVIVPMPNPRLLSI